MSNSCLLFAPRKQSGVTASRLGSGYLDGLTSSRQPFARVLCLPIRKRLLRPVYTCKFTFPPFQDTYRNREPNPIPSCPKQHHAPEPTYPPKKPHQNPKPKTPSPTLRIRLGVSFVRPPLCTVSLPAAPPTRPPPPQCVLTGFSDAGLRRRHTVHVSCIPRFLLPDMGRFGGRRKGRVMSAERKKGEVGSVWVDLVSCVDWLCWFPLV